MYNEKVNAGLEADVIEAGVQDTEQDLLVAYYFPYSNKSSRRSISINGTGILRINSVIPHTTKTPARVVKQITPKIQQFGSSPAFQMEFYLAPIATESQSLWLKNEQKEMCLEHLQSPIRLHLPAEMA